VENETEMSDQMDSCYRTVERIEQWARIRQAVGEDVTIGRASMRKSRLFFRLMTLGLDPLPLPPPRAMAGPWYQVVEDGSADLGGEYTPDDRGCVSIWGDGRWRVLASVEPDRAYVVTHPGAIGRWNLFRLPGPSEERPKWRLVRISADREAGWGPHIDHITERLARYFARPKDEESLVVEVAGMTTAHLRFVLYGRTTLRYETVGEVYFEDLDALPDLQERIEGLGFVAPDGKASDPADPEAYTRSCEAPVDVRALATDAVIVLQEAFGVTPDRTIAVRSAASETRVP